ncbi:MAG: hypothetical protein ACFFBD_21660, partial [Candidatus Hodarchaeota archaeon]
MKEMLQEIPGFSSTEQNILLICALILNSFFLILLGFLAYRRAKRISPGNLGIEIKLLLIA